MWPIFATFYFCIFLRCKKTGERAQNNVDTCQNDSNRRRVSPARDQKNYVWIYLISLIFHHAKSGPMHGLLFWFGQFLVSSQSASRGNLPSIVILSLIKKNSPVFPNKFIYSFPQIWRENHLDLSILLYIYPECHLNQNTCSKTN